jgi:Kef-type K+ transport system membrane component KefB/mannitol/fructose-specific phosphotransferase system IIA component (Ntr-type)
MTHSEVVIFLVAISIMLFFARFLGEVFNKFKQPAIIGEIIAGILLGPTILGNLLPDVQTTLFPQTGNVSLVLGGITQLAVIMLLIVSGLEVNLALIAKQGKTALYTSSLGMFIPFALGFIPFFFYSDVFGAAPGDKLVFALFMGTAMSISALPVIARTLMDMNLLKSEIGVIIIASAIVNDLFGWIFFSIIIGMITSGGGSNFLTQIGAILLFLAFLFLVAKPLTDRIIPKIQNKLSFPGGILSFIFISGLIAAAITEAAGIHAIFGAFMAGVIIGDSSHLKETTREIIHQFVTNIFAPLFFISIGLKVDFFAHFNLPLVIIVLILAIIGKVIGCGIGARLGGMSFSESMAIGFGMNSRGAMEIILGILALQAGVINEEVFVALVVMALVTSLISAPMMGHFINKIKNFVTLSQILTTKNIIFPTSGSKDEVLRILIDKVVDQGQFNREKLKADVLMRESNFPAVILPGLALPHAKLNVKRAFMAIAINPKGYKYTEEDDPVFVTILLVSPADKPEAHLNLLAETVSVFKEENSISELISCKKPEEVLEYIQARI